MIKNLGKLKPKIDKTAYIAESAEVIGKIRVGKYASIWPKAVLRGDVEEIVIGNCSNIQDGVLIHTNFDLPTVIGDYVTVGHGVILHGCRVGNNCLIGMGAIILDGAKIEEDCVIGAGTLITENKVIPKGSLVIGTPGKVARELTSKEIKKIKKSAIEYKEFAAKFL